MKRLFLASIAIIFCNLLNAQIQVNHITTGTYGYNSLYQGADLHFYLLNDGHYSFEPNLVHEFGTNANGNTVNAYHSEPYDNDQVEKITLNTVNDGIALPMIPYYNFPNKVALMRSWELVNGKENFFILMFENRESDFPISGCIEFHFTVTDTDISEPSILDDYANDWVDPDQEHLPSDFAGYTDKFVWTFSDLKKDEQRFIYIPAGCLAEVLDLVDTRAVMMLDDCSEEIRGDRGSDGALPENDQSSFYTLRSQVKNFPHDPNSIVTDPNCLVDADIIHTNRYKIYFQNDGVDPVVNVHLDFLVDAPFNSIELINSSHQCEMIWQPTTDPYAYSKNVYFNFVNIFLEGMNSPTQPEYEDTYGWVEFDICFDMKSFSYLGIDCATSNVDIYFDGLPPVSAQNEICRDCGGGLDALPHWTSYSCPPVLSTNQFNGGVGNKISDTGLLDQNKENDFQVYPNPTDGLLYFNVEDLNIYNVVKVKNTAGEILVTKFARDINQGLDVTDFPSGVYYISLQNEGSVKTKAFVKL